MSNQDINNAFLIKFYYETVIKLFLYHLFEKIYILNNLMPIFNQKKKYKLLKNEDILSSMI